MLTLCISDHPPLAFIPYSPGKLSLEFAVQALAAAYGILDTVQKKKPMHLMLLCMKNDAIR